MVSKIKINTISLLKKLIPESFKEIRNNQISQTQLFLYYQQPKVKKSFVPPIDQVGFRVYSQSDEDGILLYIYSLLGFTNKRCVELACGTPVGTNTANLICNWGWTGLLIDSSQEAIDITNKFYIENRDTAIYPPTIIKEWVTRDNINDILKKNNYSGEIDLLSLDLDGNDYWIWKEIKEISPRVIILEYQYQLGDQPSVSIPYERNFRRPKNDPSFYGASLRAFIKLAKLKGYKLVGCNKYCYNAVFVKKEICGIIPQLQIKKCFIHPMANKYIGTSQNIAKNSRWVKV